MDEEESKLWEECGELPEEIMELAYPEECPESEEDKQPTVEELNIKLCITGEFRDDIMEWIAEVDPPTSRSKPNVGGLLREELAKAPDTRWHASHLFTRYCINIGASPASSPAVLRRCVTGRPEVVTSSDDDAAFIRDIAVACVALTVKFHRDFLPPVQPIMADDFLLLASKSHTLTYDDLEAAQREVLNVFSFCVGSVTPSAYMQEFWNALPSLRGLLTQVNAWETTKSFAWEHLKDAQYDLNHLKFPASLLTACALMRGLVDSLVVAQKCLDQPSNPGLLPVMSDARCRCSSLRREAERKTRLVEMDLKDLLNFKKSTWEACKKWLEDCNTQEV
ncbi:hypothetical protein K474DRAFT_1657861 [Panus rudis PR-1116 ss-1]|nr:hypothetical protein K474DRAFT_1657861 [Panus rudis PR-1116 ss-1]